MERTPLVIGLVGQKGSGKGTVANLIAELVAPRRVETIRFSDVLRETLMLWDIPVTREHLQDLAAIMVQRYGSDALAHAIDVRIRRSDTDVIIIDGVRWAADAVALRQFPQHLLVHVTAPIRTRYERLSGRGEKVGEDGLTFERFLYEEGKVNEVEIPTIGATADVTIVNDGTLAELRERVADTCARFLTSQVRQDRTMASHAATVARP